MFFSIELRCATCAIHRIIFWYAPYAAILYRPIVKPDASFIAQFEAGMCNVILFMTQMTHYFIFAHLLVMTITI